MSFTNVKICISRTRDVIEHIDHVKCISNNLTILDEVRSICYSILDKNSHRKKKVSLGEIFILNATIYLFF